MATFDLATGPMTSTAAGIRIDPGMSLDVSLKCLAKSKSGNCYLDGYRAENMVYLSPSTGGHYTGTHWRLRNYNDEYYTLECLGGQGNEENRFLDAYRETGRVYLSPSTEGRYTGTHWRLREDPSKGYTLECLGTTESAQHRFLDAWTDKDGKDDQVYLSPRTDGRYTGTWWKISPIIAVKSTLCNFQFEGDPIEALKHAEKYGGKAVKVDYGILADVKVVDGQVVSNTYSKDVEVSDSFSWGMKEDIGVSMSVEMKAGIPFACSAKTTVSGELKVGSHQDWTATTTRREKIEHRVEFNKPGHYKISIVGARSEGIKMKYKARVEFRGYDENGGRVTEFDKLEEALAQCGSRLSTTRKSSGMDHWLEGTVTGTLTADVVYSFIVDSNRED